MPNQCKTDLHSTLNRSRNIIVFWLVLDGNVQFQLDTPENMILIFFVWFNRLTLP